MIHIIALFPILRLQFTNRKREKSSSRICSIRIFITDILLCEIIEMEYGVFVGIETVAGVHVVGALVELLEFWLGLVFVS